MQGRRLGTTGPSIDRVFPSPAAAGSVCLLLLGLAQAAISAEQPAQQARPRPNVPVPIKILRYSQRLVDKYDRNGDGHLDEAEWSQMQGSPRLADADRDGLITVKELADRVTRYGRRLRIRLMPSLSEGQIALPSLLKPATGADSPEAAGGPATAQNKETPLGKPAPGPGSSSRHDPRRRLKFFVPDARLPQGLPEWFLSRDADGDAQLTMAEFAPKATQSLLEDFARYDLNRDGVITAAECTRGPRPGARQTGQKAGKQVAPEAEEEAAEETVGEGGQEAAEDPAKKAAAARKSSTRGTNKPAKRTSKKRNVKPQKSASLPVSGSGQT